MSKGGYGATTSGAAFCLVSAAAFGAMSIFTTIAYKADVTVVILLSGRFVLAAVVFWGVSLSPPWTPISVHRGRGPGAGRGHL